MIIKEDMRDCGEIRVLDGPNMRMIIPELPRVIIACDFPDRERTLGFLEKFIGMNGYLPFVKIGMELYYAEGPDIVREIKDKGFRIFLDLKLHDIPNTVGSAMKVLSKLSVDMTNVHAAGGSDMMKAAREALPDSKLIAVTQLTSTSEERMQRELLIERPLEEVVLSYAENAKASGLDGVVCSPLESPLIHERLGRPFLTVTPGVRFSGGKRADQARVTTPKRAGELGSDYIVVGRPITQAEDPLEAYLRCVAEFCPA